jgi:FAD/FMN-containing dehydrogenase
MILSGWGRHPRLDCALSTPRDMAGVVEAASRGQAIARGNGRSYGDSSLNRANTISMRGLSRMLAFDEAKGRLVAEAGVMLADIIDIFLPRGWFPAVTPGTKYVTLGGAIAADVHGKNHHKHGSFATCVDWVEVLGPDGEIRRAAPGDELFAWTVGGMGLTGIILRAAIRLARVESGWIRQTQSRARNLPEAIAQFEAAQAATYSVAWIDCLATGSAMGRSLVMLGEHALAAELGPEQARDPFVAKRRKKKAVPFDLPGFALNRLSVGAFNLAYYLNGMMRQGESLIDFDSYFYPLDALLEWNRIYGRAGFAQFQCVIPLAAAEAGIGALLKRIAASGQGSFLAVLKRMGAQTSRFSFPMEGYTLALDFPIRRGTARLFAELQAIAVDHGGRFYLAKDSFLDAQTLRRSDPRAEPFAAMRREAGFDTRFASAQSERLSL